MHQRKYNDLNCRRRQLFVCVCLSARSNLASVEMYLRIDRELLSASQISFSSSAPPFSLSIGVSFRHSRHCVVMALKASELSELITPSDWHLPDVARCPSRVFWNDPTVAVPTHPAGVRRSSAPGNGGFCCSRPFVGRQLHTGLHYEGEASAPILRLFSRVCARGREYGCRWVPSEEVQHHVRQIIPGILMNTPQCHFSKAVLSALK